MTLEILNISKSFGGFRALNDVSLNIPVDDIYGLIGPNGAGKSTLFSVISGFLRADAGTIRVNGRDISHDTPQGRAHIGMVRTFQVPREFRHMTVRENLMASAPNQTGENLLSLFLRPSKVKTEERQIAEKADDILGFLKLDKVADLTAGALSGGQKKLLELGRTLMVSPKLVLLDEPFAGVNPVLIEEIMIRIRELNAKGIGFLVIEHDLNALTRLVSRLAVMDQGTLIAEGEPQHVLRQPRVREAYLGGAAT